MKSALYGTLALILLSGSSSLAYAQQERDASEAAESELRSMSPSQPQEQRAGGDSERSAYNPGVRRSWKNTPDEASMAPPAPPTPQAPPSAPNPPAWQDGNRGQGPGQPQGQPPSQYQGQNPGNRGDQDRGQTKGAWDNNRRPDLNQNNRNQGSRDRDDWNRNGWGGNNQNRNEWDRNNRDRNSWDRNDWGRNTWERPDNSWQQKQARPRYDRRTYGWTYQSQQRYRGWDYSAPRGFYFRSWTYGDVMPRSWWSQQYRLYDWWNYGLPIPPVGYEWVRAGDDALLVDMFSGRVVQIAYDLFW